MPVNRIKPISIAGECWSYSHFQWCWFPRSQIDTEIHFYQSRPADKKVIGKSQSKKSNLMVQIEQSLFCANSGIDLSPSWGEELVSWDWEKTGQTEVSLSEWSSSILMDIKILREGNDCDISDLFGLHYKVHAEAGLSSNISITIMIITLNITLLSCHLKTESKVLAHICSMPARQGSGKLFNLNYFAWRWRGYQDPLQLAINLHWSYARSLHPPPYLHRIYTEEGSVTLS